ncbi:MAG TPA: hypothetical protein VHL60_11385 [Oxalicibacterium sp.]|jgi:uncharacterized membrane protein|nr:hypothetical protein [Oxalicibacterium sp.]
MNQLVLDPQTQSAKNLAWWLYIGHGISFLFSLGALSWIPLIINYVKRSDTAGTFIYSHHSWQIRSFWWYFIWVIVGLLLFTTVVGIPLAWLVWSIAWIWKLYRLIRGLIDLNDNKIMP